MRYSTQDEISALGNPVKQYKLSEMRGFYFFIVFFFSLACFLGWLIFSSWRVLDFTALVGGILFTLISLAATFIILNDLRKRTRIIRLFEHGVSFECRAGHSVMPWEMLQKIVVNVDSEIVNFILYTHDEKKLTAHEEISKASKKTRKSYSQQMNFAEVIQHIAEKSYDYRLETALSLYEAGKQIDFKRFQVSMEGVHVKKKTLPWQQISAFRTNENETVLAIIKRDQKRPWKVIHSQDIPNEDVLAGVVTAYYPQILGK